jgi:dihydroorotate dehydrogenase (NAD+) catalytic subunit
MLTVGFMNTSLDMRTDIGGLELKNPVMTASGTFGYGEEFDGLVDLNRLGAIVVKGISLNPSKGNPSPRVVETTGGMLNAIGLENVGLDAFIHEKLPYLDTVDAPVVVNIYGKTVEEYAELARRLDSVSGVAAVEVNISCPNVKAGGVAFGVCADPARSVVRSVREKTGKPLIVKLSPNVTDITEIARAVEDEGADAISLINTLTGMAVDIHSRRPKLANTTGGLCGPAIKRVALRMVWEASRAVDIPVIGMGGIMEAQDALEFIISGASAIQVGTANFVNPRATMDILDGLEAFMTEKNINRLSDLTGTLGV